MISFSNFFGLLDKYEPFASRAVGLIGTGKLCPEFAELVPRLGYGVSGEVRLDNSRKIVSISSGEPSSTFYIASASKTPAGKLCVRLQQIAQEVWEVEFEDKWTVRWNEAVARYLDQSGNPARYGDPKQSLEAWKEYCATPYGKSMSAAWCQQTGP